MRILIDSRMMYGEKSGIGYYLENLLHALAKIDAQNEYTLFYVTGEADARKIVSLPYPNFRTRVLRLPNPVFMRVFADSSLPYQLARRLSRRYDLVHEPGYGALPFAPRSVVTLHDLIFFRLAEQYPPAYAARYQRRMQLSARNAAQVIADSEQTRRDAIALLDLPPEKVHAIPLGVNADAFALPQDETESAEVLRALGITRPFFLAIGDLYRRKNYGVLIEAFAQLSKQARSAYQLVIAGAPRDAQVAADLHGAILTRGLHGNALLPGYVPEPTRRVLMNRASALLYPSLYEGFGLPPLEAMACGVPTISSDNSSIPEVVGDAGLRVGDYRDPEAWAQAITRLLTDTDLRRDLIQRGRERVQLFTWERTARETLRVYELAAHT